MQTCPWHRCVLPAMKFMCNCLIHFHIVKRTERMTCLALLVCRPWPLIWGLFRLGQNTQSDTLKIFHVAKPQVWRGTSVNQRRLYETRSYNPLCVFNMIKRKVCLSARLQKSYTYFHFLRRSVSLKMHRLRWVRCCLVISVLLQCVLH